MKAFENCEETAKKKLPHDVFSLLELSQNERENIEEVDNFHVFHKFEDMDLCYSDEENIDEQLIDANNNQ